MGSGAGLEAVPVINQKEAGSRGPVLPTGGTEQRGDRQGRRRRDSAIPVSQAVLERKLLSAAT